ncbi:MAG: thioesterase family protein [Burkholderiaceae bacterium]
MSDTPGVPLPTWRGLVRPEWTDYNGHLNDAHYLVVFSFATDALMRRIGLDEAGRKATGHSIFTLESHINYLLEVKVDTPIEVHTQILGVDAKRMDVYHTLHVQGTEPVLAANEQMLLNVDMSGPRAAPFAPSVLPRVQALAALHKGMARPQYAGRSIALPA